MFYTLISRIPYIYNIKENNDKLFKIFLLGSICYVLLHALLYCKKYSEINFINNNKKLLFYLAGIDYSVTISLVFFVDKKKSINENENNNKIINKEKNKKTLSNKKKENKCNSPFINKNEAEQLKKNYNDNESLKRRNIATSSLTLNTPDNNCNNEYCEKPNSLNTIKENKEIKDIKDNNSIKKENEIEKDNKELNEIEEEKNIEDNKSILLDDTEFPVYN